MSSAQMATALVGQLSVKQLIRRNKPMVRVSNGLPKVQINAQLEVPPNEIETTKKRNMNEGRTLGHRELQPNNPPMN